MIKALSISPHNLVTLPDKRIAAKGELPVILPKANHSHKGQVSYMAHMATQPGWVCPSEWCGRHQEQEWAPGTTHLCQIKSSGHGWRSLVAEGQEAGSPQRLLSGTLHRLKRNVLQSAGRCGPGEDLGPCSSPSGSLLSRVVLQGY